LNARLKEALRVFLPRRIRDHRIQRGSLRGAWICTSWHDYPGAILGTTEAPLLAWFAQHVGFGETWLDIGAHYGYTSIALSRLVGKSGRVFAFEPVGATACIARTRESNHMSQLTIVPLGLSADPAIRSHSIPISRGMADCTAQTATQERIRTVSLDSLWESLSEGTAAIHGIKVDVQGMEGEVLAGMQNLLCRWRPKLIVEFHRGVDRGRIVDLIESCGYGRGAVPPVEFKDDHSYAFFASGAGVLEGARANNGHPRASASA
jgi:FkbM family methyltransferase